MVELYVRSFCLLCDQLRGAAISDSVSKPPSRLNHHTRTQPIPKSLGFRKCALVVPGDNKDFNSSKVDNRTLVVNI